MRFWSFIIICLLFLSTVLEIPEPEADWYGIAYITEILRQQKIIGLTYVADVCIVDGPQGHNQVTVYWLPGKGCWVEISEPVVDKED